MGYYYNLWAEGEPTFNPPLTEEEEKFLTPFKQEWETKNPPLYPWKDSMGEETEAILAAICSKMAEDSEPLTLYVEGEFGELARFILTPGLYTVQEMVCRWE